MDDRMSYIWLAERLGAGGNAADALLEHFGSAKAVFDAPRSVLKGAPVPDERVLAALCDKSPEGAERAMEECLAGGYTLVTPGDEGYPDRLRNIPARPLTLYVKGTLPAVDDEICVAVVGTRQHSVYGGKVAERMSAELAGMGVVIVSGMARGLDTLAHKGALKSSGRTIAVLGSGIDVVYPKENRDIYEFIARDGAVVSEFPPGTPPYGHNFPIRNRIISGLSLGAIIVEAGRGSGALITARCALEQGRDVFAVPGNISSPLSEGTNGLIRDGAAKLVQSPLDIIGEYITRFPDKIIQAGKVTEYPAPGERKLPAVAASAGPYTAPMENNVDLGFSNDESIVYNVLTDQPMTGDDITVLCGLPYPRVAAALTMLEMKEKALRLPGGRFAKR